MSMASATSRGSDRMSVMEAVSMATSEPEPMAMPTSAAASAGASFTPSPTMATNPRVCARSASTFSTLPAGSTESKAPSSPSLAAIWATGAGASPLTSQLAMPRWRRMAMASGLSGLRVSARAAIATATPSMATQTRVAPSAGDSSCGGGSMPS
ncbi:hypothetical protein D3C73_1112410 [compost metagenome]